MKAIAPTRLELIDCAPLRADDVAQGFYIAACGIGAPRRRWRGCVVLRSLDGGRSFNDVVAHVGRAATLGAVVHGGIGGAIVRMLVATPLLSTSSVGMAHGANLCIVGSARAQFMTATLSDVATYTLAGLVDRFGAPIECNAGDRLVMADANLIRVPIADALLSKELVYAAITAGVSLSRALRVRFTCRQETWE